MILNLIEIILKGHIDAALLLIDKGAQINIETCIWRDTPLDFACHSGLYECVERLIKNTISSPNSILDKFDKHDYNGIHHKGLMRRTPLHWASISGNCDVIIELLRNGADPMAMDIYGFTPGELAEQQNKKDAASLLKWWPSRYYPQFTRSHIHNTVLLL